MIDDFFKISLRGLKNKGIRSWLTMVGIFVGIAAIVSLISLGEGLQNAMFEQFEMLGYDLIYVMPGSSLASVYTTSSKLTDQDLEIIKDVRGVEIAGGFVTKLAQIEYRGEIEYAWVSGMGVETQEIFLDGTGIEMVKGRDRFREGDTYKAAVGYEYWSGNVFEKPVGVGDRIKINGKKFEIIGEISRIGNSDDDRNIYILMDTAEELFDVENEYITIMARVKPNYDIEKVADEIKKEIRRDRGLKEGEEDFQVQTMQQLVDSVSIILDAVQAVVIGIAFISLFVGGLGIMNTMYTSVLERTQEIGVMKAVGAKNSDILVLFMIESGTIGLVGGLVGCVIGGGLSKGVEYIAALLLDQVLIKASLTPELIIGSLAFSFIVGCISGMLPARQASQLKPVDALRYE
ncbi:MAG: ABC transporter permease [Candidatus Altiarchaeales archaeon ex4484_96]|nr:MAG: ABC transporter permease [Candidatus Altiarchaeales archaeon ex4484_96]